MSFIPQFTIFLREMVINVLANLARDPLWNTNETWTVKDEEPIIGGMHDFFRHIVGILPKLRGTRIHPWVTNYALL